MLDNTEDGELYNKPTDNATNACVLEFAHDIVDSAKRQKEDCEVAIDFYIAVNSSETLSASKAKITSHLGTIMVCPRFKQKTSCAYIINKGVINRMMKEGFSEEFIQNNGSIYSDMFEFTQKSIKQLGYYLTHKINHDTSR